jgi:hypothetical protein
MIFIPNFLIITKILAATLCQLNNGTVSLLLLEPCYVTLKQRLAHALVSVKGIQIVPKIRFIYPQI